MAYEFFCVHLPHCQKIFLSMLIQLVHAFMLTNKKKAFSIGCQDNENKIFLCACLDAQNNCDAQNNYLSENWNFLFMFYYCLCLIFHEHVNKHLSTKKTFFLSHFQWAKKLNIEQKCWKKGNSSLLTSYQIECMEVMRM